MIFGMSFADIMYIVVSFFTIIVGTLSTIVLIKIIRLLNSFDFIVDFATNIRKIKDFYTSLPNLILSKIKDIIIKK